MPLRAGKNESKVAASRRKGVQGATRNSRNKRASTVDIEGKSKVFSVWLNRMFVLLAVGVVLFGSVKTYFWIDSIEVQQITVTGNLENIQTKAVQEMVQESLEGGFLHADLQRMREQLESLPWIYETNVRRQWPSSLQIHVVEQLPIARWGSNGFLNHQGNIFQPTRLGDWGSLPLLRGPEGSEQALMAKYLRLIDLLRPLNLKVEQLSVDERGELDAVLLGGARLIVGSDEFLERMHRFAAIYRSELAPHFNDIERVDLRYSTGLAVAYREDSQVAGL